MKYFIVNSFIGKKGNIGYRVGKILDYNEDGAKIFARGFEKKYKFVEQQSMYGLGHISRVLNLYRIKINKNFNHKKFDNKIFNIFLQANGLNLIKNSNVFITDPIKSVFDILKNNNNKIIYDMPMVSSNYINYINNKYNLNFSVDSNYINDENYFLNNADAIICPSYFVYENLSLLQKNNASIINFGTDLNEKIFIKNNKSLTFLFVGNVNKRKGVDSLIKIFNEEQFKNDRLYICGRLNNDVALYSRFNNIKYCGYTDPSFYYRNSDVLLFPSLFEGSAKVVYEAASYGLPILATTQSGSIFDKNEIEIVDPHSYNSIKLGILNIRNYEYRVKMSKDIYSKIKLFTWENYARRVLNVISKC